MFAVFFHLNIIQRPDNLLYPILFQGHLALAFYLLVMFAGAFKHKSKAKITLLRVRRELAVIGFFMVMPHAALLIIEALSALNPTGTIAVFLMVPLVITSFPIIRRKFSRDGWLGFHKWAYITYGLIYVHLVTITVIAQTPPTNAYEELWWLRLIIYTMIFAAYLYLKFNTLKLTKKIS
jgi:DMSO/TMAO reductase YedYZ heme-binding membrane subunit